MKTVARMALKPGMVLGEDVLSYKNDLLYEKDTKLTDISIKRLARYQIMAVSILEPEDLATTHYEKIRYSNGFKTFETIYEANLSLYKSLMAEFLLKGKPINQEVFYQIYFDIRNCVSDDHKLLDYLYYMLPSKDDLTYSHCLNSSLIAGVFSKWLKLNEDDTKILIMCGFFYDIGKALLPNEVIWKPGKLTNQEFQMIKKHTINGFLLLKDTDLDENILKATLQHHERCDGTGYPSKLKDVQINKFAKITSIIDAYEAMTSARIYRESLDAFSVIENFLNSSSNYSDSILYPILTKLSEAQIGRTVRLSNGQLGEVTLINYNDLNRPLVKINGKLLNLSVHKNIKIVATL